MARAWMTRFDPWADLDWFQRRMNELFDGRRPSDDWWATGREFPAVNVFSQGEHVVVTAELPGLRLEDIDLSITGDVLTLRGERRLEQDVDEDSCARRERGMGAFVRSIQLPERVTADKAEARYVNGVLEVRIPKSPEAQPKRVAIQPAQAS